MPPQSFFCDLCQKGYARSNELEAHENSYDHQHKKRLRDMKAMTRPTVFGSTRKKEQSDMMSSNLKAGDGERSKGEGGGMKGFKPIGFAAAVAAPVVEARPGSEEKKELEMRETERPKGEDYEIVEGPIPWEELRDVGDLVDLDALRPREMQKVVDIQREHMRIRKDPKIYQDIWSRIGAGRKAAESESPPRAMGLGA